MSKWVIGDIHGCYQEMRLLLNKIDFSPSRDMLISVGDLVNRGPHSVKVLEYCMALENSFKMTLGNHDLHLLSVIRGIKKGNDTLQAIARNTDKEALEQWLRRQTLILEENNHLISHAGIAPTWSKKKAFKRAQKVSKALLDESIVDKYLAKMYGDTPLNYKDAEGLFQKLRVTTNYFTRMRYCYSNGDLDFRNLTVEGDSNSLPWFNIADRKLATQKILFGHWALLQGVTDNENAICLDTSCVYGKHLTVYNIETQEYCIEPSR